MRRTVMFGGLAALAACVVGLCSAALTRPPVLLVGDSITGQYGPTAAAEFRHDGYSAEVRAYPGVGLLDRGPRVDLTGNLGADLHRDRPAVVVAEFSGNYGVANPPIPGVALDSSAFFSAWTQAAEAFTQQATSKGATVVWVLPPGQIKGDPSGGDRLAAIYQQLHGVAVVDARPAFAAYERSGNLHAPDGRHLSAQGVQLLARLVSHHVGAQPAWRLQLRAAARSPLVFGGLAVAVVCVAAQMALGRPRRTGRLRTWIASPAR